MRYDSVVKRVRKGDCKTLKEWQEHSAITADEFLEGCRWVCDDPKDEGGHATRLMALTPAGWEKVRIYWDKLGMASYYRDPDRLSWGGSMFRVECGDKRYADDDGKIRLVYKVGLDCKDSVY